MLIGDFVFDRHYVGHSKSVCCSLILIFCLLTFLISIYFDIDLLNVHLLIL